MKNTSYPANPRRNSLRRPGHDYSSPGAYFVTLCIAGFDHLLGEIILGEVCLSEEGEIVRRTLLDLPVHYPTMTLGEWVVMPNHVHVLLVLSHEPDLERCRQPSPTVSEIVRGLKSCSARAINTRRRTAGKPVWQRGFHDRIVRDNRAWFAVRRYIRNNPAAWRVDLLNPTVVCGPGEAGPPEHHYFFMEKESGGVLGLA